MIVDAVEVWSRRRDFLILSFFSVVEGFLGVCSYHYILFFNTRG